MYFKHTLRVPHRQTEYNWVAKKMQHFVRNLLDRPGHVNISDRDKGIPHFLSHYKCWNAKCAQHINKNIYSQPKVRVSLDCHVCPPSLFQNQYIFV